MKSPALSVAVILLIIAVSCKKDGSSPLEPLSVYNKTSKTKINTRLFALSGEIKNSAMVDRYAALYIDWLNGMAENLYPREGFVDNLKVLSPTAIDVSHAYQYSSYNLEQKGNNLTLTAEDTVRAMSYHEVFTRTIPYNIALHKPLVFREQLVTSTRGLYGFEYFTLPQYHFEQDGDGIRAPWIIGVILYNDGGTTSLQVQNKLDAGFHKKLTAGDTVIIQEYAVHYEK